MDTQHLTKREQHMVNRLRQDDTARLYFVKMFLELETDYLELRADERIPRTPLTRVVLLMAWGALLAVLTLLAIQHILGYGG